MKIVISPTSNFNERSEGGTPTMIVLHYTGTTTAEDAAKRFMDAAPTDSAGRIAPHYMVEKDGKITRFVEETKRAWHAGVSYWRGQEDINAISIGIEVVNSGHEHDLEEYPAEQIAALQALIEDIRTRWPIASSEIVAHSDVAPGRKVDPGEKFPWGKLALVGIGLMPNITYQDRVVGERLVRNPEDAHKALRYYGYSPNTPVSVLVTEFQRHFLPHYFETKGKPGTVDLETCAAIASLARQAKI